MSLDNIGYQQKFQELWKKPKLSLKIQQLAQH